MGDWYEKQTIGLLPDRAARRWGRREALAFKGERWTFAEQSARVDATAKGLLARIMHEHMRHPHPDPLDRGWRGSRFDPLAPGGGEGQGEGGAWDAEHAFVNRAG